LTPGQYVRVEDTTPHYSGFHNLGSLNWRKGNNEPDQELGEPLDAVQRWTRSDPLPISPITIRLGTVDCLAGGETYTGPVDPTLFWSGFANGCWQTINRSIPQTLNDIGIEQRQTQYDLARLVEALYDNEANATAIAVEVLGPGTTVTIDGFGTAGPWPGSLIADNGNVVIVAVEGTTNFQQFALQGFYSLAAPSMLSGYGTLPYWLLASEVINDRIIAAGIDPNRPILFVGHSFGAAAVANVAVRYHRFLPDRDLRIVTFGMPKPGDARFNEILAGVPGFHFANSGDPISSLAPGLDFTLPFFNPEINALLGWWAQYTQPHARYVINADGNINPSTGPTFELSQIATLVIDALLGNYPDVFTAHLIATYRARLTPP